LNLLLHEELGVDGMSVIRTARGHGLGWLPDLPDSRDFSPREGGRKVPEVSEDVPTLLRRAGVGEPTGTVSDSVDLRDRFSPIEDQGELGSCTANAGVGLVEYYERCAFGKHLDASRLFLYKATRNLMGETGDTGAFLRTTMQALATFGVPPEEYMPYDVDRFDEEPTSFAYAFAQAYKAVQFYRLDPGGTDRAELLARIKTNLAAKLPVMFGFSVYSSYTEGKRPGDVPFPSRKDRQVGGHAIVAAGYDDTREITGPDGATTTGALLFRNSWGEAWGEGGYGWLPYDYVTRGLAVDWWSLIQSDWIDTNAFGPEG
jgi:C1A family cysteine protease